MFDISKFEKEMIENRILAEFDLTIETLEKETASYYSRYADLGNNDYLPIGTHTVKFEWSIKTTDVDSWVNWITFTGGLKEIKDGAE